MLKYNQILEYYVVKKWIRVIPDDLEWFSTEWEKQNTKMCILYKLIFCKTMANKRLYVHIYVHMCVCVWFPDSKESTCNAGDLSLIPGLGRSSEEGNGYPL